jgi:phosphoglycerate dehydrogenase-like enzyme
MATGSGPPRPRDDAVKVLVTPRSVTRGGHPALQKLRDAGYEVVFCTPGAQPGEDELMALLPGCVGYLAGVEPVSARVLESATDLRAISRNGTGADDSFRPGRVVRSTPSSTRPGERFRYGDLAAVLSESDVISLHCPADSDGRPLIDADAIQKMKRGVYLVNTARGGLLDGAAVLDALSRGRIAGVAVDAYVTEPPGDDPLVRHDRVIATPHTGAYTDESVDRAMEQAVDNLLASLRPSAESVAARE